MVSEDTVNIVKEDEAGKVTPGLSKEFVDVGGVVNLVSVDTEERHVAHLRHLLY